MRVLLLNQVFYPDVAATAQHGHDLARDLVNHGHEVTAIASRSIYGQKGASLPARETVDGIEIHRVGRSLFGKAGIIGRLADFLLFYLQAFVKAMFLPRHDVVVCFTTPPFIALVGVVLRLLKGTRFIYWVMDVYPDVAIASGLMKERAPIARILESLHRWVLRRADAVVVLGRCMRDRIVSKGVPADRVHLIGVWSDQEEIGSTDRANNPYRVEWGTDDRLLVMYSGNFGIGHDVDTFLNAAQVLRNDDRIRFAFVGGGKRKSIVEAWIAEHELSATCTTAAYQPRERLGELLTAADVHLATMLPGWEGVMVPSKLFVVLAAGRPVLFVGPPTSEVSLVVEERDCGFRVDPGEVDTLVDRIRGYADDRELVRRSGDRAFEAIRDEHGAVHRLAQWRSLIESFGPDAGRTS